MIIVCDPSLETEEDSDLTSISKQEQRVLGNTKNKAQMDQLQLVPQKYPRHEVSSSQQSPVRATHESPRTRPPSQTSSLAKPSHEEACLKPCSFNCCSRKSLNAPEPDSQAIGKVLEICRSHL